MPWHYLDYFIHPEFQTDQSTFYKARLLVGILLAIIFSVISFFPFFAFIEGLPQQAVIAYTVSGLSGMALWAGLLYLLKTTRIYFRLIAHIALASMAAVLLSGIGITGGPIETEVHPLLSVPAIIAYLLLGHKQGSLWTIILLTCFLGMAVFSIRGFEYINLPPESIRPALRLFNWGYAFLTISALTYLYELINTSSLQKSADQQERYRNITNVALNSETIFKTAQQLSESGEELLNSTIDQKASIENLATTTEELLATSEDNLSNASNSLKHANTIKQLLMISHADSLQLNEAMQMVKDSSDEIQEINNLINDIAQQTNLLSLNAMIEASRFDEEQSGFQVVALEVKKLAERSVEAVENINKVLAENTKAVAQGVELAITLTSQMNDIQQQITPVTSTNQQVVDGCNEQTLAIGQINHSISQIDGVISNNRKLAMNATLLADQMQEETAKLKSLSDELN